MWTSVGGWATKVMGFGSVLIVDCIWNITERTTILTSTRVAETIQETSGGQGHMLSRKPPTGLA